MKRIFGRSTITNLDRFLEVYRPDQTTTNGDTIEFEWHDKLAKKLEADIGQMTQGPHMGKLQSLAQRIAQTKQNLEAQADKLSPKLDAIDQRAPDVFAHAQSVIGQQSADIDAMESELNQLSNLPST